MRPQVLGPALAGRVRLGRENQVGLVVLQTGTGHRQTVPVALPRRLTGTEIEPNPEQLSHPTRATEPAPRPGTGGAPRGPPAAGAAARPRRCTSRPPSRSGGPPWYPRPPPPRPPPGPAGPVTRRQLTAPRPACSPKRGPAAPAPCRWT